MEVQGILAWAHWALGPVVPLFLGTPWDVMHGWLADAMPVVHHRIGFRHVVLVGDAAGMKRIFQVRRPEPPIVDRRTHVLSDSTGRELQKSCLHYVARHARLGPPLVSRVAKLLHGHTSQQARP